MPTLGKLDSATKTSTGKGTRHLPIASIDYMEIHATSAYFQDPSRGDLSHETIPHIA